MAAAGGLENSGNPLLFRHTLYKAEGSGSSQAAAGADSGSMWDAARGEDLIVKAPAYGADVNTVTLRCSFYRLKGEDRMISLIHIKRPEQNAQSEVAGHVSIRIEPPKSGTGAESLLLQLGYRKHAWATQRRVFSGKALAAGGPPFPVVPNTPFWLRMVFIGGKLMLYIDSVLQLVSPVDDEVGLQGGKDFEIVGACAGDYGERSSLRIEAVWAGKCIPAPGELQQAEAYIDRQRAKEAKRKQGKAAGAGAGAGAASGGAGAGAGAGVAAGDGSGAGSVVLIGGLPPGVDEGRIRDFLQMAGLAPTAVEVNTGGTAARATMQSAGDASTAVGQLAAVPLAGRRVTLKVVR